MYAYFRAFSTCFLFFLLSTSLPAQVTFSKLCPGGNFLEGAEGPDGKIYLHGTISDSQGLNPVNSVTCLDPWGEVEWQATIGDTNISSSSFQGVSVAPDGRIYVGLFGESFPDNRGLVCLSPSGSLLWAKEGPTLYAPHATRDSGVVIAGRKFNTIYFHKLDASGNLEWAWQFPFSESVQIPNIIETDSGYVALASITQDMAGTPVGAIVLIRFAADGSFLDSQILSRTTFSIVSTKVFLAPDGNLILRYAQKDLTVTGSKLDIGAMKITPTGDVVWGKVAPELGPDLDFTVSSTGESALYSYVASVGNVRGTWARFDPNGNLLSVTGLPQTTGNMALYVQDSFALIVGSYLQGTTASYSITKSPTATPGINCPAGSAVNFTPIAATASKAPYPLNPLAITQLNSFSVTSTLVPSNSTTLCDSCAADAAFAFSANSGTVDFSDLSAGNIGLWNWDFGDGTQGSGSAPSHTYSSSGTYNVCLVVEEGGCVDSICQTVPVVLTATQEAQAALQVIAYPNPTSGPLHLDLRHVQASQGPLACQLIDPLGRTVRFWAGLQSATTFNLAGLPPGLYRLQVRQGIRRQRIAVVIQ